MVCTLGPKSRSVPILEELLKAGMSVARFNFSHGSHDYHQVQACCQFTACCCVCTHFAKAGRSTGWFSASTSRRRDRMLAVCVGIKRMTRQARIYRSMHDIFPFTPCRERWTRCGRPCRTRASCARSCSTQRGRRSGPGSSKTRTRRSRSQPARPSRSPRTMTTRETTR